MFRHRFSYRCLLRIDAQQYLQWIPCGTFEKRTVQRQMLLGHFQFNDFGECSEPGSGQGVEIVRKGLMHVTHGNGLAVPSPDIAFIGLIDTGEVVSSLGVEVNGLLQGADIGQKWVRYRENETPARSEARMHGPE